LASETSTLSSRNAVYRPTRRGAAGWLSAGADSVALVVTRWTPDQVLALGPDPASQHAAARLAASPQWSRTGASDTGASDTVVWGLCAGSGQHPYQTIVDLSGPAYKCTCPSRKFPCKHALALLLRWAGGTVPDAGEPADFAASWIASRAAKAAAGPDGAPGKTPVRDERAAARRAEQRESRVGAGLAELETWLRDQVRAGLSATSGGYQHAERVAARMVDAQAPGVAAVLRGLGGIASSGAGWPDRLLGAYAQLHLLIRAHDQLDALPPDLAAVVRSHVGYQVARQDVLATPPARDHWLVLGVRDILDAAVPVRRILLHGQRTARYALLLIFDPRGGFGGDPDAWLRPGDALDADLHYYPGQAALRAQVGHRHADPAPAPAPGPPGGIAALLEDWAGALAADPWLASWPALLAGTPVPGADGWQFADRSGQAVPLVTAGVDCWLLLAVSGGAPVTVAGEWSAEGLRPLTAWHAGTAVIL
jgi:hypothetical protein